MTTNGIEESLGVYALDAVTEFERRQVDRAIERDESLRAEADALLAVSDVLAADLTSDAPAPDHVWNAIAVRIGAARPAPTPRAHRPRRRWLTAAAGAAAMALVAVLAVQVFVSRSDLADLRSDPVAAAATAAADRADSLRLTLSGDTSLDVVVGADGVGYVLGEDLPPLDPATTYQLWAIVDDRVISAGVLVGERAGIFFRYCTILSEVHTTLRYASSCPLMTSRKIR